MHRWLLPLLLLACPAWADPPLPRAQIDRGRLLFDGKVQHKALWPGDAPDWALASPQAVARYDTYRWQQRTSTALVVGGVAALTACTITLFANPPADGTGFGDLTGPQQTSRIGTGVAAGVFVTGLVFGLVAHRSRLAMAPAYEADRR